MLYCLEFVLISLLSLVVAHGDSGGEVHADMNSITVPIFILLGP